MRWFTRKREPVERRSFTLAEAEPWMRFLGLSTAANETVTERSSLGLTAVFRSVQVIAGTIAGLPLKTYRERDGLRERVPSWLDSPGGPDGPTRYEWIETLVAHMLLHGEGFGLPRTNGAGAIVGLQLLHPAAVGVEEDKARPPYGRRYRVQLADGQSREFTERDLIHFIGLTLDGVRGMSPISVCRNAIGTGIAGEKAAGRMFSSGLMLGGVVSVPEDFDEDQARQVKEGIRQRTAGHGGEAGDIAVVNAAVEFNRWTMSAEDAQFIQSRTFQIEEIARLYGVPKVLLAEDGASTWGSGIAELIRGFQRFTLAAWTSRIEQRLTRLLPRGQYAEFDYAGLLAPSPHEVTQNLAAEVEAGLLTVNEARAILNRPPLPDADQPSQEDA